MRSILRTNNGKVLRFLMAALVVAAIGPIFLAEKATAAQSSGISSCNDVVIDDIGEVCEDDRGRVWICRTNLCEILDENNIEAIIDEVLNAR